MYCDNTGDTGHIGTWSPPGHHPHWSPEHLSSACVVSGAVKRSIGSTTGCTITEKALAGAFPVIVKTGCETDGALHGTSRYRGMSGGRGT